MDKEPHLTFSVVRPLFVKDASCICRRKLRQGFTASNAIFFWQAFARLTAAGASSADTRLKNQRKSSGSKIVTWKFIYVHEWLCGLNFDREDYITQVERKLVAAFPEHWLSARRYALNWSSWKLKPSVLSLVFYVTNGLIVIEPASNFNEQFISQFGSEVLRSTPNAPLVWEFSEFSARLQRYFYDEIINRHFSSIPLRLTSTILVLVKDETDPAIEPFHLRHGHRTDPLETVLCVMETGSTPPSLQAPRSTMTSAWQFLECPGDELMEILRYSPKDTRVY